MLNDTHVKWPNDARIAIVPLFLLESWPEDLGMAGSLNRGGDRPVPDNAEFKKDLSVIRDRWFGESVGIYRVLDVLNQHNVKSTFFLNGKIAERNGQIVKTIHENGHEIATETYDHSYSFMKDYSKERADIRKSIDALRSHTLESPKGYLSPGLKPTFNTPNILVQENFHYWVDFDDDEVPYWLKTGEGKILVIPNMRYLNDYSTFSESARTPEHLFQIWKDTFDYLYEEGDSGNGKLMLWDNHIFLAGRPNRTIYLSRFLKYAKEHPGTWFARAEDISKWWKENYDSYREFTWDKSFLFPP